MSNIKLTGGDDSRRKHADENSSGDEIAKVNFLRRYRTRTSKYQKQGLLR